MFPLFLELIGLDFCMVIFMLGSMFAAFFIMYALEETKGQTLDTLESSENK